MIAASIIDYFTYGGTRLCSSYFVKSLDINLIFSKITILLHRKHHVK